MWLKDQWLLTLKKAPDFSEVQPLVHIVSSLLLQFRLLLRPGHHLFFNPVNIYCDCVGSGAKPPVSWLGRRLMWTQCTVHTVSDGEAVSPSSPVYGRRDGLPSDQVIASRFALRCDCLLLNVMYIKQKGNILRKDNVLQSPPEILPHWLGHEVD